MSHVRSPLTCCRGGCLLRVAAGEARTEREEDVELHPEEFNKAVGHCQTQRSTSSLSENAGARLGDLRVYENSFKATKILLNLPEEVEEPPRVLRQREKVERLHR